MTAHTHLYLTAQTHDEVRAARDDAWDRRALIACWLVSDAEHISWCAYVTPLGDVVRLTYTP